MKIIDLSIALENGGFYDLPAGRPQIQYFDHQQSVPQMLTCFPSLDAVDLPDGLAWASEELKAGSHTGTHVDAPWHYHPTMNNGEKAWSIDEVPLDWFFGDGVVVDFSGKPDGYRLMAADFQREFARIGYTYKAGDIVLVHTAAALKAGTEEYCSSGCGVGREGTLWLVDQGMRVCGTDAWSWDRPLVYMDRDYQKTKDKNLIWEGHLAGKEKAYCQIEKLTNLDKLPSFGFKVICLPIKIKGGSAGWSRVVAILEE